MVMTIEDMLAIKAEYEKEMAELKTKIAVVDDFINFVSAKEPVETETEEAEEEVASTAFVGAGL